jgi:hypothetical protein
LIEDGNIAVAFDEEKITEEELSRLQRAALKSWDIKIEK